MGDPIKEGTRGRVTKGAEPGCNARRYCKELALHFAQWADPLLAADMQEALQLLISGQITTEASVNAAVSLAAAAHIGRSKAGALDDNLQLEGIVDGMDSLGLLPPSQVFALVKDNQSLRDQVQALRAVILDLTEMPMGPSREAEKDLPLWFYERDLRINEATSNVSLAFGTPPVLYIPRSQEEDEARGVIEAAEARQAPQSLLVNQPQSSTEEEYPGVQMMRNDDDEMTFDDD